MDERLRPTRRAFAIAALCVVLACAVFTLHPVTSNDTFWHIACGTRLLETGQVPRVDEFTFTHAGSPWVNHEYLSGALFALADRAFGLDGVTILCAVVVLIAAILLWTAAGLGTGLAAIAYPPVLCAALFGALPRLIPRPHVFSLAFAAFLSLVLRDIDRGRRRLLWLVPPILWLWAQLHGGFLLGIAFLGLLCVRLLLDHDPASRRFAVPLALAPLLLLLGPYGHETFTFPLRLLRAPTFMAAIEEWQPLLGGAPLGQPFCHHAGLAIACAGIGASAWLWRRKESSVAELLWLVGLAALALKMRRGLAYPVLASTVPLTHLASRALARARSLAVSAWLSMAPVPLLCVFLAWGIPVGRGEHQPVRLGLGLNIPEQALDFIERHGIGGNCYNSYSFGAYITYRLWPRARTAIDSRNLVYSEVAFNDYRRSLRAETPFREAMLRQADFALLAAPSIPDAAPPILAALRQDPRWHLVHFDDSAFLFLSDRLYMEKSGAVSAYRRLRPDLLDFEVATVKESDEALEEARRATEEAPGSATAWLLRGRAAFKLAAQRSGDDEKPLLESRFSILKAIAIPDVEVPADTYYLLARAEARLGDPKTAVRYARECLARASSQEPARGLIEAFLERMEGFAAPGDHHIR